MLTKFYFYNLHTKTRSEKKFNWKMVLEKIFTETKTKKPHYERYGENTLSMHILKKEELREDILYLGYIVVGEDDRTYQQEKSGDFFELKLEDGAHLLHRFKGKLYFLISLNNEHVKLMLERQYFALSVNAVINYFNIRYSDSLEKLKSKTILGRELTNTLKNIKGNNIKLAKICFRKSTPEETIRKFGFVEEAIPSLLNAELCLHWREPISVADFCKTLFRKKAFEDVFDTDFGEFLKTFSFETDSTITPKLNLLDRLICFELPLEKANCTDSEIFDMIKDFFIKNKDKVIGDV